MGAAVLARTAGAFPVKAQRLHKGVSRVFHIVGILEIGGQTQESEAGATDIRFQRVQQGGTVGLGAVVAVGMREPESRVPRHALASAWRPGRRDFALYRDAVYKEIRGTTESVELEKYAATGNVELVNVAVRQVTAPE